MGRRWARALAAALAMAVLGASAAAEEARGNLEERFADVPRMECDGETWYLKSGLMVLLLAGLMPDGAGALRAGFVAAVAIDDGERQIAPVILDPNAAADLGDYQLRLGEIAFEGDGAEGMEQLVEAANGLLGAELIWRCACVDLNGISAVPEIGALEGDARQRMRQLRQRLEELPSGQLDGLYAELGDCLITDLKGGEAARAMEKAERYARADSREYPLLPTGAPDVEAASKLLRELFYEEELF